MILLPWFAIAAGGLSLQAEEVTPVGTTPLSVQGDIASQMVSGIDRFLLAEIDAAAAARRANWRLDHTSPAAFQRSLEPHRARLAESLGVVDPRLPTTAPTVQHLVGGSAVIASSEHFDVYRIRWPVLGDPAEQLDGLPSLFGEGLMLVPRNAGPAGDSLIANVIVLTDADQTAEQVCGLAAGIDPASQVARRLAESGCRVIVPDLVSRQREQRRGRANLTDREYLHRASFMFGRTLAGYEIQSVLALVDWLESDASELDVRGRPPRLFGYGEGGMLACFAGALDTRIAATCVSGFLGPRDASWQEPLDRNFFGLLKHFDAAELALLFAGRRLVVETSVLPTREFSGEGGAPAELGSPSPEAAQSVIDDVRARFGDDALATLADGYRVVHPSAGGFGSTAALAELLPDVDGDPIEIADHRDSLPTYRDGVEATLEDTSTRRRRQLQQIDRHNQALLGESHHVRQRYLSQLDTSSLDAFGNTVEAYRERFRDDVIGRFERPLLPPNPRSRQTWETDSWTGHEVMLDVFPDVFAYGVLLVPKDLKPGERRPVVVCQHGLEGRPVDTFQGDHRAYHDFAAELCQRGLIVFAPQNPYLFQDRFRTLQRKAQPLGKTLFSVIVPQHQQIVDWLKSQPFVDPERIAFYGLSYGGKTAMRVPALVTDYCLSICSADFNEWVLKNASTRDNFSYIWTGEYEIFEWNLGGTFNYAEMAALICPRPFMVERGHFDGVAEDRWVGYEFAKVRNLYAAKLGIGERAEIEWFVGPHTINGQATFDFLGRHLDWPGLR